MVEINIIVLITSIIAIFWLGFLFGWSITTINYAYNECIEEIETLIEMIR